MNRIIKVRYMRLDGKIIEHEIDPRDTQKFMQAMRTAAIVGDLGTMEVLPEESLDEQEAQEWVDWCQYMGEQS